MVELTHRNTRRYGGYLVHMGVVLMFIGFTGKAFDKDTTVEDRARHNHCSWATISCTSGGVETGQNENYTWPSCRLRSTKNGQDLGTLDAGASRVYRRKAADLGSRHPAPPE